MAQLDEQFDSDNVEPAAPMELLPHAWYPATIMESEYKDTAKGGKMICFTWRIIEGPFENRRVWQRLNYINQSEKAQEIGRRELSAITHACGLQGAFNDTAQAHDVPCQILVGIQPASGEYQAKNVIKGVKPLGDQEEVPPPAQQPAPAAKPAPAVAGKVGSAKPWQKKAG